MLSEPVKNQLQLEAGQAYDTAAVVSKSPTLDVQKKSDGEKGVVNRCVLMVGGFLFWVYTLLDMLLPIATVALAWYYWKWTTSETKEQAIDRAFLTATLWSSAYAAPLLLLLVLMIFASIVNANPFHMALLWVMMKTGSKHEDDEFIDGRTKRAVTACFLAAWHVPLFLATVLRDEGFEYEFLLTLLTGACVVSPFIAFCVMEYVGNR